MGTSGGVALPPFDDVVKVGQYAPPRALCTNNISGLTASGAIALAGFTADKTAQITKMTVWTGTPAAAATPTLCRMGIYTVEADESLTLTAAVANDTTLFAATFTSYERNLTTTFSMVAGSRYACALLVVSGTTIPQFQAYFGGATGNMSNILATKPFFTSRVAGQTDLPATVAAGTLAAERSSPIFYVS